MSFLPLKSYKGRGLFKKSKKERIKGEIRNAEKKIKKNEIKN